MSVLSVARDVLGYAVTLASTPAGAASVVALGGPVATMVMNFGVRPLHAILSSLDASVTEITEEVLEAQLAKGVKVERLDTSLKALYGWDEVP